MNRRADIPKIVVISSPSGGGKTTVIKYLLSRHPEMVHSISWTTRPRRPGGVDEGYYDIVSPDEFRNKIEAGGFAEWTEVHGFLYGTPKEQLDRARHGEKWVLLDLDVVGGTNLKEVYGDDALLVFLVPPSIDELKARLESRGTDTQDVQKVRLDNALKELDYQGKYDHRIVNDDLNVTCREIEVLLGVKD